MPQINYSVTLTQKDWDKRKPTLAKVKSTGIGAALKALEKMHASVPWKEFDLKEPSSFEELDKEFAEAMKAYDSKLKPIAGHAKSVAALATRWEGNFAKEKLIPKAASKACAAIADAANAYAKQIETFDDALKKDYEKARKDFENKLKAVLKPLEAAVKKIDALLKDISTLKSKPTKANLISMATGDSPARGYCTACKYWDQVLAAKYGGVFKSIYGGQAMKEFFPPLQDYGANYSDWEDRIAKYAAQKKLTEDKVVALHAAHLSKQVGNIKTFQGYLVKALSVI